MKAKMKFVVSFSTVPAMLDRIDELINLAEQQSEPKRTTLAACATVMLAATLEQGLLNLLRYHAQDIADPSMLYSSLQKVPLAERLQVVPEVLTKGKYLLDTTSIYFESLIELVSIRNKLMHLSEKPEVLDELLPA